METVRNFIFLGSKITADGDCSHEIKRCLLLGEKAMTNLDSILKSRDIALKGLSSQSYGFSSTHEWMWELDCKESWAPKNWCFWSMVLEKTLESPLDWKEIKAGGEGHDRGWDGWMASPTQWTLVWSNSGSWWWTGKPSMLRSIGSQRVRHN